MILSVVILCAFVRFYGGVNDGVQRVFSFLVFADGVIEASDDGSERLHVAVDFCVLDGAEFVGVEKVEAIPVPYALVGLVLEGVRDHGFERVLGVCTHFCAQLF